MEVWQMRNYILQHPKYAESQTWKDKVMKMKDSQVIAIYYKFLKEDKSGQNRNSDSSSED